jgi:hypothetical protein
MKNRLPQRGHRACHTRRASHAPAARIATPVTSRGSMPTRPAKLRNSRIHHRTNSRPKTSMARRSSRILSGAGCSLRNLIKLISRTDAPALYRKRTCQRSAAKPTWTALCFDSCCRLKLTFELQSTLPSVLRSERVSDCPLRDAPPASSRNDPRTSRPRAWLFEEL